VFLLWTTLSDRDLVGLQPARSKCQAGGTSIGVADTRRLATRPELGAGRAPGCTHTHLALGLPSLGRRGHTRAPGCNPPSAWST